MKIKVSFANQKQAEAFFGPFKKKKKKDYKNMRERPLPKPESKRAHKTEYQLKPAHAQQTEAVTEEQFKQWPPQKQRAWLREHPRSKFGKDLRQKMGVENENYKGLREKYAQKLNDYAAQVADNPKLYMKGKYGKNTLKQLYKTNFAGTPVEKYYKWMNSNHEKVNE